MSTTINSMSSILAIATNKNSKSTAKSADTLGQKNPVSEFLAYQKLTPQEKIRDAVLKKYGLTQDDLASLSPENLKKIQEEIKQQILNQTKQQMAEKGILVDLSA